jgi:hypothetical protein
MNPKYNITAKKVPVLKVFTGHIPDIIEMLSYNYAVTLIIICSLFRCLAGWWKFDEFYLINSWK